VPWACTLVSPYGLALPGYYERTVGNATLAGTVAEWGPSTMRDQPLFFVLLLLAVLLLLRGPTALTPFAQLALLCSAVAGLYAIRYVVWFTLVAAATLPRALDAVWAPADAPRRPRINLALAFGGIAAAVAAAAALATHSRAWFEHDYPARAANAVAGASASDPSLRVFANERYADWLLFEDPPLAGRVAYDARFEILASSTLSRIGAFRGELGPRWQEAARGYGILVLDPAADAGAVEWLEQEHAAVLFRNRSVVVLRRR